MTANKRVAADVVEGCCQYMSLWETLRLVVTFFAELLMNHLLAERVKCVLFFSTHTRRRW